MAAMEIQQRCADLSATVDGKSPVGIDIHTGMASIGEVGAAYKDFTIIGPVVNMASRIQGAAGLGEIVVTDDVYREVHSVFPALESRICQLKGIEQPVNAYVLCS
jgi:adenylate cyclase